MAYIHEFGIINSIEENRDYSYEPEKYSCIAIDGDLIDAIYPKGFGEQMRSVPTFFNNTTTPATDLAYYGITLIPPSSLELFLQIIMEENRKLPSNEFGPLILKINEAAKENKWLIHYGV